METLEQQSSIALLWNRSSGWSDPDEIRAEVELILAQRGSLAETHQVERGMNVTEESRVIVQAGVDILVAAGGDGTINAAASALIHTPTALGVIPAGTLNHFARDLGIPLDPQQAAQALTQGRCVEVDVAAVNGRVFINNSVLGFFPEYRKAREAVERRGFRDTRLGRFFSAVQAAWRVFRRMRHLTISLEMDGRMHTLRTPFVLIGNNEHKMEGLALGSRHKLDTGLLWVYALPECTRWQLVRLVLGLIFGRTPREAVFQIFSAPRVTVSSKHRRIGVGIDGEMVQMTSPLRYECLSRALRVIAPQETKK